METTTKIAWALLALVHLPPAAVAAAPSLVPRLYGVSAGGDLGVLLSHRGVLFLAVAAACVLALVDGAARRALSVVVAISVVGFLAVYLRAGAPTGALRTIALWDAVALIPLVFVVVMAWRPQAA